MSLQPNSQNMVSFPGADGEDRRVKRRREESQTTIPDQHPDLWFEDGNVLLLSENILFRVHRSQLARKSHVFENILAGIQEKDFNGNVIYKSPEPAAEMTAFLDVLYNGWG